ncbi:hypothetical protein HETIRDRAFT_115365 [Heterobasidion irregulare TC 32-1]|uniref:Uncharacterized protein n=1 Tax=Heterobasidion irregulare (strain TC 32-1) TaxID=747525 RepID=W4KHH3_HETIT|nr:uncharacterized protein HETIRDRAFT_115365 [Heterobasidion irregulare TC 32-1]ETW85277.1 hypothetical protein HETIRDRAFT_115365 [Heterobasidion irregulare TC 32-1]
MWLLKHVVVGRDTTLLLPTKFPTRPTEHSRNTASARYHNAEVVVGIGGNRSGLRGHPVVSGVSPEVSMLVLVDLRKTGSRRLERWCAHALFIIFPKLPKYLPQTLACPPFCKIKEGPIKAKRAFKNPGRQEPEIWHIVTKPGKGQPGWKVGNTTVPFPWIIPKIQGSCLDTGQLEALELYNDQDEGFDIYHTETSTANTPACKVEPTKAAVGKQTKHTNLQKLAEEASKGKLTGDGVTGSKEHFSKVSWMVGIQKMGLHGINGEDGVVERWYRRQR